MQMVCIFYLLMVYFTFKNMLTILLNRKIIFNLKIHKFSDGKFLANSAVPDQTAPRGAVLSGSTLFAFPSSPFVGRICLF